MRSAHKTTAAEHRDWVEKSRREGFSLRRRGRSRSEFITAEFEPDTEIPFGLDRASKEFPAVSPNNREALERMLDEEGLPKILRTLRELCDARTPHEGAAFDSFEPDTEGEAAQEHADELETLLLRLARRVRG